MGSERNTCLNSRTCLLIFIIVPTFDTWAATRVTKSLPLSYLNDSVVGVDATYYLEAVGKEPLVSALGGFPFGLEYSIARELKDLQSVGLRLHFVFNGLDYGIDDDPFGPSLAAANNNALAFETYENRQTPQAIQIFRSSGRNSTYQLPFPWQPGTDGCIRSAYFCSAIRVPKESLVQKWHPIHCRSI